MERKFSEVWLLAATNAIAVSSVPMMMTGSIIGSELAPEEQWATLPIAMMVIGTALGVIPGTLSMQHLGRKQALLLFVALGICACLVLGGAMVRSSFSLFCFGAGVLGATIAALQQVRFAEMECVPLDDGPTAASISMCAGIVAAFLGPELGLAGRHLT